MQRLTPTRLRVAASAAVALLAVAWFYAGSVSVSLAIEAGRLSPVVLAVLGVAAAANLLLLASAAVAAYAASERRPWLTWFVVVVLVANLAATLADQFGWADALYAAGCLIALVLVLLARRARITRPRGEPAQ